jgi:hypothetical protein
LTGDNFNFLVERERERNNNKSSWSVVSPDLVE